MRTIGRLHLPSSDFVQSISNEAVIKASIQRKPLGRSVSVTGYYPVQINRTHNPQFFKRTGTFIWHWIVLLNGSNTKSRTTSTKSSKGFELFFAKNRFNRYRYRGKRRSRLFDAYHPVRLTAGSSSSNANHLDRRFLIPELALCVITKTYLAFR